MIVISCVQWKAEEVPSWQQKKTPRKSENCGFIGVAPRNVWLYLHNIFSTLKLARPVDAEYVLYAVVHVFSMEVSSPTETPTCKWKLRNVIHMFLQRMFGICSRFLSHQRRFAGCVTNTIYRWFAMHMFWSKFCLWFWCVQETAITVLKRMIQCQANCEIIIWHFNVVAWFLTIFSHPNWAFFAVMILFHNQGPSGRMKMQWSKFNTV